MKVLTAETLTNGTRRFIIEAVPAVLDTEGKETTPAVTEEISWGADVALEDAKRETRLLLAAKYGRAKSTPITAMVGREI